MVRLQLPRGFLQALRESELFREAFGLFLRGLHPQINISAIYELKLIRIRKQLKYKIR